MNVPERGGVNRTSNESPGAIAGARRVPAPLTPGTPSTCALRAASPIAHAAEMKPALMLAHGVLDDRVAFENARQMTAALERAGKPFVGYFPKNETHGVYGQGNREAYYGRVLDFLAEHLGGRRPAAAATARAAAP